MEGGGGGGGRAGIFVLLLTSEEQKRLAQCVFDTLQHIPSLFVTSLIQTAWQKLAHDAFDTFTVHSILVRDVTDRDCVTQNGSAHCLCGHDKQAQPKMLCVYFIFRTY